MSNKQQGFTLIELVVVIVILGILAAVAVPRFVSMQGDARFSVLQGVNGSMQSVSAMIHAKALAQGLTGAAVNLPGGNIEGIAGPTALVFGYPATAAMTGLLTLDPPTTFTATPASGTVQMTGATVLAQCQVVYTQPAAAGGLPTILLTGNAANCN